MLSDRHAEPSDESDVQELSGAHVERGRLQCTVVGCDGRDVPIEDSAAPIRDAAGNLVGAVLVNFRIEDDYIEVEAHVDTVDRTGVEMEALTACTVALLTIYDMCKAVDRSMVIGDVALWEKTGGRSGSYRRSEDLEDLTFGS